VFTRQLVTGLVAASVLLGAGCSLGKSGGTPADTPPTTASATPSLGPSAAAERDALAAYRGMWNAFVEAGKVSDPDAPDLRKYASDQALKLIVSALYTNREQKEVILGELKIDPKVTALTPSDAPKEAKILDCVNDEKWLEYKASGGLASDVPGGKHRTNATIKRGVEGWKVSSFILEGSGTC
jgi:hypothetical protein